MPAMNSEVMIPAGATQLAGLWSVPELCRGVVVFAHGSGSSRLSPRNQFVARTLQRAGFATLLLDLLDEEEAQNRAKVFDTDLLAERLTAAIDWAARQPEAKNLAIGLFGASTGAAAALVAAVRRPDVRAVVSRGGRPDLAWNALPHVAAPTLLIVGEYDPEVLQLNRSALRRLKGDCVLRIVPDATHLFEERGALPRVAALAERWFRQHLAGQANEVEGFVDRADAGRRLADRLAGRTFTDPLVLAIPRGGIVPGMILAERLNAELDVVLSRKLHTPDNPEYALGAIAESGDVYWNVAPDEFSADARKLLDRQCEHELIEIGRRRALFREGRPRPSVAGRSVIVTDDGIATGATMIAALRTLRQERPLELMVAVPVAAPQRLEQVRPECDEVICLLEAPEMVSVGQYYQDFTQVEDEEVIAALARFHDRHAEAGH